VCPFMQSNRMDSPRGCCDKHRAEEQDPRIVITPAATRTAKRCDSRWLAWAATRQHAPAKTGAPDRLIGRQGDAVESTLDLRLESQPLRLGDGPGSNTPAETSCPNPITTAPELRVTAVRVSVVSGKMAGVPSEHPMRSVASERRDR
jgi:hypothetical protein